MTQLSAEACLAEIRKGIDIRMLDTFVGSLARNANDAALRGYCRELAEKAPTDPNDVRRLNVLAAGLLGVLPGGAGLEPAPDTSLPRVNAFLHELRWAMLGCKELDPVREDRARRFVFYPEFFAEGRSLRDRIVDLANAHSGFGPIAKKGESELKVLFSLGGFFSFSKDDYQHLRLAGSVGGIKTTCCMTARGIYQAAGARMIGSTPPQLNTGKGMDISLGVPSLVAGAEPGKKPQAGRLGVARNTFEEDLSPVPPPFVAGDIYYLLGDGKVQYMKSGGLAEHVGIVVQTISSTKVITVDGGGGSGPLYGAEVTRGEKEIIKDSSGWRFKGGKVRGYRLEDVPKAYAESKKPVKDQHMPPDAPETIQGYWKPEQYNPPLLRVDGPQIRTLLSGSSGAAP